MRLNRRQAMAAGVAAITLNSVPVTASSSKPNQSICVFTKPFNSLSFDELAERIAELGFDGIEAPIRKGGHIEPEQVEDKLPQLVAALKKHDLQITVMTSDISDPNDPKAIEVLRTAAKLGIQRYRMGYLRYDLSKPVVEQLKQWRPRFRDLAAVNRELGITAVYQNHASNKNLGAAIWDLRQVLKGIPSNEIGVAYDIRHAMVEGGKSWPISFNMILPHIDTVYVKDFVWEGSKVKNVPLGDGLVDPKFFQKLAAANFQGPISLHEEYLDHKLPELVPQHFAAINNDLAVLNKWLRG